MVTVTRIRQTGLVTFPALVISSATESRYNLSEEEGGSGGHSAGAAEPVRETSGAADGYTPAMGIHLERNESLWENHPFRPTVMRPHRFNRTHHQGALLAAALVGLAALPSVRGAGLSVREATWVEENCDEAFNCRFTYVPLTFHQQFTLWVGVQTNGDHYRLTFDRTGVEAVWVHGGKAESLGGTRGYRPSRMSRPVTVVVKRRRGLLTVVQGPDIVLQVRAEACQGGKLGYTGGLGSDRKPEVRYQPVGEVSMTDDFMRAAGDESEWTQRSGRWVMNSVEKIDSRASMSTNPFCVVNRSTKRSLLTAGFWFWDNYQVLAAARPVGSGSVGVCAYYRDENDYLLFRWSARTGSDPGAKQLVRVREGKETVLAQQPGGYQERQWYQLSLKATDTYLVGLIDGREVIRARNASFGGGGVGLYADGLPLAYFDDVAVRTCRDAYDDFTRPGGLRWQWVDGAWRVGGGKLTGVRRADAAPALAATGGPDWENYAASVEVEAGTRGEVGLGVAFKTKADYTAFSVGPASEAGRIVAVLKQVAAGREKVLARQVLSGTVAGKHALRLTTVGGLLSGAWDGEQVVQAVAPAGETGKVALFHRQSRPVRFDNLAVEFAAGRQRLAPPPVPESMVFDNMMVDWSSPRGAWRRPTARSAGVYWHRGTFFGDVCVSLPLTDARSKPLELILAGRENDPDVGYRVLFAGDGTCRLSKGHQSLTTATLPVEGDQVSVELEHRALVITVDDSEPVAHYLDAESPPGHLLGVRSATGAVPFESLDVSSRNMLDYLFTTAPTDWHVQRGLWGTTNRWNCKKDWSFFGAPWEGTDCVPTIWNKHAFRGDLVFEMYAGLRMNTHPNPGYLDPSDINCTLFGDGRDLSSGYSFIYAGWHNSRSALFRKEQEVGASTRHRFVNPVSMNPAFHHHWFYIRAERIGARVRFFVDDSLVAEYEDPHPLDEGRVAIWSFNNGLMVARARIWFEKEILGPPFPPPPLQQDLRASALLGRRDLRCTFERDFGTFNLKDIPQSVVLSRDRSTRSKGRYSLKVTNAASGGAFCVNAVSQRFSLRDRPYLSFDYRFPPGVKVNLYVRANHRYYAVILTGTPQSPTAAKILGRIPDFKADDRWHHAAFDLLGAFRKLLGTDALPRVESLAFASPAHSYIRCGFGGNHWGSAFYLDQFSLGAYPKSSRRHR